MSLVLVQIAPVHGRSMQSHLMTDQVHLNKRTPGDIHANLSTPCAVTAAYLLLQQAAQLLKGTTER